jgi:hypothetical protein
MKMQQVFIRDGNLKISYLEVFVDIHQLLYLSRGEYDVPPAPSSIVAG